MCGVCAARAPPCAHIPEVPDTPQSNAIRATTAITAKALPMDRG
eukprot:CAMPEP_0177242396 /NCGR_PEP_ID=MMETSP0367-20130122/48791_1 /TAXON_ID=447022 ORGANISM="Scrippsiella hangoei-like, Strain SHHI-4" /NCGR_SAMPLE_ID=MMETSP0367 /ASSEMBLY_ACC=CAM_ASM_000362 /LENGTH=43 /DNA_ID= /DNA_START= /DNA_END= /DNA_ORIENTATION=